MSVRIPALFAAIASCALSDTTAYGQVPEGTAVIGTFAEIGMPGVPGLFLVPLGGGPMTPVTGLPPELSTTFGGAGSRQGTWSLAIRPSDGALIVGTIADTASIPSQGDIKLFVLHLNGSAVDPVQTQEILLGTTSTTGVANVLPLPDGRTLVTAFEGFDGVAFPLTSGPMASHPWAIVDVSGPTPVFTPLPTPQLGLPLDAGLALDPTGEFVYRLSSNSYHAGSGGALTRIELATGNECGIANWTNQTAFGLQCDDDGVLYVSSTIGGSAHFIHTVHPDGCNPAVVTSVQSSALLLSWGLALDRAGDCFLAASVHGGNFWFGPHLNRLSAIHRVTGQATVIAGPVGGWGTPGPNATVVNNTMESYGVASDNDNHHWFQTFPNPGGQPAVGNGSFSLTLRSAPATPFQSAVALSFGRGSTLLGGIELLVDPVAVSVGFVPVAPSTFAMPIPSDPGLAGVELVAQSLHFEPNASLSASRGLHITLQ